MCFIGDISEEKNIQHNKFVSTLVYSGSCSLLAIRGSWVRIPLGLYAPRTLALIPGGPQKNGTVDTVNFQDFALINNYRFHLAG